MRLNSEGFLLSSVQNLLFSRLLFEEATIKIFKIKSLFYRGTASLSLAAREEPRLR
jgi:hypothetical protein